MKRIRPVLLGAGVALAAAVASAADAGGVLVTFKAGSPSTLPPDGVSRTVLVVRIDPTAAAWGGPIDVKNGRFSLDVSWLGAGKLTPRHVERARFPAHITVTSWKLREGVRRQRTSVTVTVTYHPPGDRAGRKARSCKGRAHVTVEAPRPAKKTGPSQEAQLVAAVRAGDCAAVAKLLGEGANPNCRETRHGFWPLHMAVFHTPAGVKLGAGDTAPAAMVRTRRRLIELLLNAGAAVNCRDKQLATPLHLAAGKGQTTEVVRLLLDRGADPTARMHRLRDPRSPVNFTPVEAARNAARPWSRLLPPILAAAAEDKGWEPAHEYTNCFSYTIYLLTGQHLKQPVLKTRTDALQKALRARRHIPLPHRSRGMTLGKAAILKRLRHGDVLVIGDRHSATALRGSEGMRFRHFAGQTVYDGSGTIRSRSDLGLILNVDPATGKRTYKPPGTGNASVSGGSPGARLYEVHCSPRERIAAMARGRRTYGQDSLVIWRRLGQHKRGRWYLVADDSIFVSASDRSSEKSKRTFALRYDVEGKFEDRPEGITFTGGRKETDPKTRVSNDATLTAVFDDRMTRLVSLKVRHTRIVPDRGAVKGSRMDMTLEAADVEVRTIKPGSVFCRTPVPAAVVKDIKHTVRRGRWLTSLKKVGSGKVTWLQVTFDDGKKPLKR